MAIPLNGVEERLDRLLLVEGLVIAGVLLLLAVAAWVLVRVGLRPLDRIGQTADAIAAGDLSRRVDVTAPRTEVGRLGLAFNAMLERLEEAFRQREAERGAAAALPGRRVARAAHAAGVDPRLLGAVPDRRGARARRTPTGR